jgi:hypothetical protein
MRIAFASQDFIGKTCYIQQARAYINMAAAVNKTAHPFNKQQLESVLTQRFFYAPAFEIYGGECSVSIPNAFTVKRFLQSRRSGSL